MSVQQLQKEIGRWILDPTVFVREVLGATPRQWQAEALKAARDSLRMSVRSGNGVGKTSFEAWMVLWFHATHFPAKTLITGSNYDNLRATLWAEVGTWYRRMPAWFRDQYDYTAEVLRMKERPEESFAILRTASKDRPEALAGFHSKNMFVVADEASGIDDEVFRILRGALTTQGSRLLMCGNPTRSSGYFYDSHHNLRELFWTKRVNCLEVKEVDGPWCEEQRLTYGETHPYYIVHVLGDFPPADSESLIPLHLLEEAKERDVEPTDAAMIWGVDVARGGEDRSTLCKRKGNVVAEPVQWWTGLDTMELCDKLIYEYWETPAADRPGSICIDVIGLGAGVVDRLRREDLPVRAVNVAETPSNTQRFFRLRDELWFKARDWVFARDCKLPDQGVLIGELSGPRLGEMINGKIKVESKDDMRRRGLRSPDVAEAFVLTFASSSSFASRAAVYNRARPLMARTEWNVFAS